MNMNLKDKIIFKELELPVVKDRFIVSQKAIWNGGDGVDWVIEKIRCKSYFQRKHLDKFIVGTEVVPVPIEQTMEEYVEERIEVLRQGFAEARQSQFDAMRMKFNLPVIEWGLPDDLPAGMDPQSQGLYAQDKFFIVKEYHKDLGSLTAKRFDYQRDYRNIVIENRKLIDKYEKKCLDCNQVFREVFGPSAMAYIENLVNENKFKQAWDKLNTIYSTSDPNLLFTTIYDRCLGHKYDGSKMTVAGSCQMLEDIWLPIATGPNAITEEMKLNLLLKSFEDHPLFEQVILHCRRSNLNYEQTKALILKEANMKIEKITSYKLMETRIAIHQESYGQAFAGNVVAQAFVRCWHCGKTGHYAKDCKVKRTVQKDFIDKDQEGNDPVMRITSGDRAKEIVPREDGYSSAGSQGSNRKVYRKSSRRVDSDRESVSSRSSKGSQSGRRYPKTFKKLKTNKGYKSSSDTESDFAMKSKVNFLDQVANSQKRQRNVSSRSPTPKPRNSSSRGHERVNCIAEFAKKENKCCNCSCSDVKVGNTFLDIVNRHSMDRVYRAPSTISCVKVLEKPGLLAEIHGVLRCERGWRPKPLEQVPRIILLVKCQKPLGVRNKRCCVSGPLKRMRKGLITPIQLASAWRCTLKRKLKLRSEKVVLEFCGMMRDFMLEEGDLLSRQVLSDNPEAIHSVARVTELIIAIFDSGCTSHMTNYLHLFDFIIDIVGEVVLPNGTTLKYMGRGRCGCLDNVLLVPDLNGFYISISKLDKEGCTIITKEGKTIVYDRNDNFMFSGTENKGLYYLDNFEEQDHIYESISAINVKDGSAPKKMKISIGNMTEIDYLHHRMGHPSERAIKEGIRLGTINGTLVDPEVVMKQQLSYCPDCLKGKFHQLPLPKIEKDYDESGPMDFMAHDTKGPFRVQSFIGHHYYFDLFAYKRSRWLSIRFKRTKDGFFENFRKEMINVNKFGYKVKHFQTDDDGLYNKGEFIKSLDELGIFKRTSVAYHHYSNGWIERSVRTAMEKATTKMLIYNCPLAFWIHALEQSIYEYNRTPNKALNWRTPLEDLTGEIPDISHWVPFYCSGIVFLAKEDRDHNLSAKGLECRMLGYDEEAKNAYLIWVPSLKMIKRAVNVVFREGIDLTKNYQDDESRDISRFKDLVEDDKQFEGEKICDNVNFFDDTEEPYFHLDDVLSEEEGSNALADDFRLPKTPNTINEALADENKEQWVKAMQEELDQLLEMGTFIITTPLEGEDVAKMRFVFQTKLDNDFLTKFKARLVLCGYSQIYGINYLITYSPTVGKDSLRIVIVYILKHGMIIVIYDFKSAFIEGFNDFRIVALLPVELFPNKEKIYVEVVRSLYGEKQAAFIWYSRLKEILCDHMNFELLIHDEAIFIRKNSKGEIRMIIAVHVDDLLVGAYSNEDHLQFMKEIKKYVRDIKATDKVQKYLGMEISRTNNTLFMKQEYYVDKFYDELDQKEKGIIKKKDYPGKPLTNDINPNIKTVDILPLVGKLRYVIDCTRLDGMATLGIISEKATKANYEKFKLAYELLSFLYTTKHYPLKLHAAQDRDIELFVFCDASYNVGDGLSRLGGAFYLGYDSGVFSCYSKKEIILSNSAMEAEVRAIDRTIRQVVVYRELLAELGHKIMKPTKLYTDSHASVNFFKHYRSSKKLKHILKLVHMIRHAVNEKYIELVFIKSEYNVADILTKVTTPKVFKQLQNYLLFGYSELELNQFIQDSIVEYSNLLITFDYDDYIGYKDDEDIAMVLETQNEEENQD